MQHGTETWVLLKVQKLLFLFYFRTRLLGCGLDACVKDSDSVPRWPVESGSSIRKRMCRNKASVLRKDSAGLTEEHGAQVSRQNLCVHPFVYFFIYLYIAHLIWPVMRLADGIFFGRQSCHGYGFLLLSWRSQTYRGVLPAWVLCLLSTLSKFLCRTPCLSDVTLSSFGYLPLWLGFTSFPDVYGWDRFHLIYRETSWYHHGDHHSESSLYLF